MSLLMKALKQAEQRHQQATAEALQHSAGETLGPPDAPDGAGRSASPVAAASSASTTAAAT